MKKIYLLILFLISFNFFSLSQNINVGVIAGINATQVAGDGYSGFNKAGVNIGGFAEFDISEKLNFQFEILYSQKGSRRNPKTDEGDTEFFLLRMDYIEVPLMVRFENNKFTYEAGAYFGQLVNSYLENENGPFTVPPENNQLLERDLGLLIGLNFNFTENLIMNWRFSNSILPVRRFDSGESFRFKSGLMHTSFSFTLRYEFFGKTN
tara:strand:- start:106 stop:729 length:624 start_codon:yes stop_codon:yes gene_type:complete